MSRPEQMAHLWHELHQVRERDATHPSRIDPGWWECRGCRRFSPYHRAGRLVALTDIAARLIDSMASTNTTQTERRCKNPQDNWRRRGG